MSNLFDAYREEFSVEPLPGMGRHRAKRLRREARQEATWRRLCAEYGNKCLRCGATGVHLTRDHVIPVSRGGPDLLSNMQPLCQPCNQWKDDQVIDYRPAPEAVRALVRAYELGRAS